MRGITWRPRAGRVLPYALAAVVVVATVMLAVVLPSSWGLEDRVGLVVLGVLAAGVLHLVGRCRVTADEHGLTIVNVARVHRYAWAEVLRVTMDESDPWPSVDLADGTTVAAMGIQGSDGEPARRAAAELRALVHERGEAPEPD